MVRSVRSSASLLAIALLVPAALAAFAAPSSARLTENVTLNLAGQFGDAFDTEMLQLDLMGGFAVQVPLTSTGSVSPVTQTVVIPIAVSYNITWPSPNGAMNKEHGEFQIDSFFDVFFDVATQKDPATGDAIHYAIIADAMQASAKDVPLGKSPYSLSIGFMFEQSEAATVDLRTGASTADSFFDISSDFTLHCNMEPVPDAFGLSESRVRSHVGLPPGPNQAPTAQLDSFFDVTFGVLHPPNPNAPATASSFFDVFVEVTPSTPNPTLDIQNGSQWQTNAAIRASDPFDAEKPTYDVSAGEDTKLMAMLMDPLLTETVKIEHEGFGAAVGVNPGPVQFPLLGDSFFDVFLEIALPRALQMLTEFEARIPFPSGYSGQLSFGDFGGLDFHVSGHGQESQ